MRLHCATGLLAACVAASPLSALVASDVASTNGILLPAVHIPAALCGQTGSVSAQDTAAYAISGGASSNSYINCYNNCDDHPLCLTFTWDATTQTCSFYSASTMKMSFVANYGTTAWYDQNCPAPTSRAFCAQNFTLDADTRAALSVRILASDNTPNLQKCGSDCSLRGDCLGFGYYAAGNRSCFLLNRAPYALDLTPATASSVGVPVTLWDRVCAAGNILDANTTIASPVPLCSQQGSLNAVAAEAVLTEVQGNNDPKSCWTACHADRNCLSFATTFNPNMCFLLISPVYFLDIGRGEGKLELFYDRNCPQPK